MSTLVQSESTRITPVIILVRPQMGENIGTAARAMLNCGLTEMRLVAPRDGWPNQRAFPTASGADCVLERASVFENATDAVSDLHRVFATTARTRDIAKPVLTPRDAAPQMMNAIGDGQKVGILFGAERSGLDNDEVALADTILTFPLNPDFMSLNLAQAILLVAYEWRMVTQEAAEIAAANSAAMRSGRGQELATKEDLEGLFIHLEEDLEEAGFFVVEEKRGRMVRNIRAAFQRARMTDQEVRTWRGIIKALSGLRRRKNPPKL
ncbi:MAG: RNA methyltransferase [Pseudomonadota bacterium]